MDRLPHYALLVARVLISVVFILNSVRIIDQTISAKGLMERGAPVSMVPSMTLAGRTLEFAAGFALALGIVPRLAALALLAFRFLATYV
jgi:uncharacterized membrane protein YphA (DoxX/SURF4 family)